MSIPNKREDIVGWIEWVLARPGHPEYLAIDFAKRSSEWYQGGQVGPEPLFEDPLPVMRRLVWGPAIAEIEEAREIFSKWVDEGMIPHRVKVDGSPGRRIVRFNSAAEEVVFCHVLS